MKKIIPVLIILLISVLISCNNGMGADSTEDPDQTSGALVVTDSSKGVVFVDEAGDETVIKSVEGDEEIVCKSLIDYALFDDSSESVSKSSVKRFGQRRAVILGYRSDGCPGLWIVYSGGTVKPVVNSEDIETSELLEMAEARQPLFKHFGWNYKALDMVVNGSEIIIAGYAENEEGIPWFGIDPGTTIGLYWAVIEDYEGYYHISRARVVGYKDNEWWKRYRNEINKPGHRSRFRWLHSLRLFFFGWYDRYLTMTESVETGENPGEYLIKGPDDEGTASVATVTVKKVLGIEEAPDDPDPEPDPTGNIIVFASDNEGSFEIYSLDYEDPSANPVKLTNNSKDDKHPALSKDGSSIVFVSDQQIYTMDSDGSNVSSALASLSSADDGNPSWNNDGSRIVYDNDGDIYVMDANGENQTNITNTSGIVETKPSWRSESGMIVYERGSDIFETDASGVSHTKLTTAAFVIEGDPSLSPDGSRISFIRKTTGFYNIYIMNTGDSDLTSITDSSADESSPAWSSDGSKIAYVRGNAVYYKNADGSGSEILVTDNAQDPSW